MWRLIVHGILRRRFQSLSILLGVALSVALLFAVLVLYAGLRRGLELGRERLGADLLVIPFHAMRDGDEALFSGAPLNVYMNRKIEDQARAIPGVSRVEGQFFTQTLKLDCCGPDLEIRLVGIEPDAALRLSQISPEGGGPLAPDQVVIGARLMDGLGWKGSQIELLGDIFHIAYHIESTGTGLDQSILMPIDAARRLAAASQPLQRLWQNEGPPDQLISALLVQVDDLSRIDSVATALGNLGSLRVVRPSETFRHLRQTIGLFTQILAVAGSLPAVAGIVYLFTHVTSAAWDRKGEWALYRALGATRIQLVRLLAGEALVLALSGAVLGVLCGLGLYHLAAARLLAQTSLPFVPPGIVFTVAASAAAVLVYGLIGLLAAALPAWRVAHLEPARIMAQGEID